jgi:hypothetical protein
MNSNEQEQYHAIHMLRNWQQGRVLCPARLLRSDQLLCAGLLRAIGLLHLGELLLAFVLCPTAAKGD